MLQIGSFRTQPRRGARGPVLPVNTTRVQGGAGNRHVAAAEPGPQAKHGEQPPRSARPAGTQCHSTRIRLLRVNHAQTLIEGCAPAIRAWRAGPAADHANPPTEFPATHVPLVAAAFPVDRQGYGGNRRRSAARHARTRRRRHRIELRAHRRRPAAAARRIGGGVDRRAPCGARVIDSGRHGLRGHHRVWHRRRRRHGETSRRGRSFLGPLPAAVIDVPVMLRGVAYGTST